MQYVAKFCQHLPTISQPLRQLEKKEVEWCWEQPQNEAFKKLKDLAIKASTLEYFELSIAAILCLFVSKCSLSTSYVSSHNPQMCYAEIKRNITFMLHIFIAHAAEQVHSRMLKSWNNQRRVTQQQ